MGWLVCDTEVKHTCPQPVTGLVFTIQTGVHGFDYRTPQEPVVSKSFKANIWLRSFDHLTDVGGQMGGCQQLATERVRDSLQS